jgi:N-acetyl-S-(2-succino)cysteine monooxygenase
MEEWFATGAADGFVIQLPNLSRGIEDFVHAIIPELQRRGLFRIEYEDVTLRGNLGMTPVAAWQGTAARDAAT